MSLKKAAEDYFGSLNSVAARIHQDMEETKLAYEDLWNTISEEEKQQILSESIIKPEILLKYQANIKKEQDNYAIKLIVDDNNCSYQDEHSGPFSFKTRSQRDLSLYPKIKDKEVNVKTQIKTNIKSYLASKEIKKDSSKNKLDNEDTSAILPKTGLDFLDNW